MQRINLTDRVEKDTFRDGENEILRFTCHVPQFEGENTALCAKLNAFYADAAKEFHTFCTKKYAPALRRTVHGEKTESACGGASMKWTLTFENESVLSLLTDISIFDGKMPHLRRFCHTWDLRVGMPLSARQTFDTSGESRKKLMTSVCGKIDRGEGGFAYYPDAARRAKRYFDPERFYLTPRGVAFYYPDGLLFPSEGRFPAYVVPYDAVKGFSFAR